MRFNGKLTLLVLATSLLAAIPAKAANPPAGACIYALDPTAHRALQIAGATSVTTACSAAVASNATDAFEMEGSETLFLQNHSQVGVVGGWQLNNQTLKDTISNQTVLPFVITAPSDPFLGITAPTTGTIVSASHVNYDMNNKPAGNTLQPGVYCGGLTIGNTNGVNFTLSPGTYVIAGGGLTFNSQAKIVGSGVTVYNTSSTGWGCSGTSNYTPINIDGQSNVTLSAPTTGSLAGILFFGNRTGCATLGSCQNTIQGGSTTALNGALYFKSDTLLFSGANSSTGYMMLVADIVHINGNSTIGVSGNPINGISVSVTPPTASLTGGQTQQFSATVANTGNQAVTWTISPSTGSISTAGLYTAPATITTQSTVTVTATSAADTTKSATATVTLNPPPPPISVTVAPSTVTLSQSGTQTFTATVANSTNQAVTWTVTGGGTIDSTGHYTAPATITTTTTATVKATSAADTTKSGTATVTLNAPPVSVTVAPATVTLSQSGTQTFTATVANSSNQSVTWSVTGGGTIDSAGHYIAPATITAATTATVKAVSAADTTKSGTATVTLNPPPISVTVAPLTVTLSQAGTQTFTATVANSANQAVTWTVTGGGSIDSSGHYLAPATITTATTATVTATSAADTTKSGTATVTLNPPPISVTVAPSTVTLSQAGTQTFTATVANSANQAVTWTVTGGGSIDSSGHYLAPATITTATTATVTATSAADTTKSGTATVTLNPPPISVTVAPSTVTLSQAGTQTFTATVANSANQAVTWTVTGGGSIDSSGHYLAPATITTTTTATVTATSAADTTKSGTATVTLNPPPISVTVAPSTVTLSQAGTQTFTATVANSANQAVTWTVTGGGSIDSSGHYLAPATITTTTTATVTATSAADTTKFGTATVTLNPPPISVTVAPSTVTLSQAGTQTFTATVANSANQAVTWTVTGGGSIDSSGHYLAPATITTTTTATVTATSAADTTKSGTATVTLNPPPISVTVAPSTVTLSQAGTQTFTATVANSANQAVTWTVTGGGSIDSSGHYLAPATITTTTTATVTATSAADTTKSGTATVTLNPPPISVTVAPSTVTLSQAGTQTFTATVANSANQAVTWTVTGGGSIDSSGHYLAPATITTTTTATVTATSAADTTKSGTATVTLNPPPISVTVAPSTVTLSQAGTQTFTATVANSANQAVTWTVTGGGSIDSSGHYLAPATITTTTTATVTATSAADTTKFGTATVTLNPPPISVTVAPSTVTLSQAGTQTFTATVANSANQAVTWTVTGGGSIDSSGHYLAPATITTTTTATVTATSAADTTKSGTATVTLNPPPISVTVAPSTVTLSQAGTQTFTATVANSANQAVTWTVTGGGSIDSSGHYLAPATITTTTTATVTATSAADTTKSGTATVTLNPPPISVTVAPSTVTLSQAGTQTFTATVANSANQAVTWTVTGGGSIDSSGHYLAPATITTTTTATVTATSAADTTKSGTATVTLNPPPISVTVAPSTVTLSQAGTQTFTATVANSANQAVTWTVTGGGSIDSSGHYLAPATITTTTTATVTATSAADTTKFGTATVTLNPPPISVTVAPSTVTLSQAGTQTFTATVANSANQAVTWTVTGGGSIDSSGHYLAPATITTTTTATVTATSAADTTKSGTATVTLNPPPISVTVAPSTVTLSQAGTQTFTATVANSANQAVTWTVTGGGSIDSSGHYLAPATITTTTTATVTATSAADTTKSGTATVTLNPPPISVTVAPSTVTLSQAGTQTFTATVANSANQAVTWTVTGGGSIDSSGHYLAPATITTTATATVTATSAADTTKSGTATVTLNPPPISVTVAPSTVTLSQAGTQTFTATVANSTNQAVTWTVTGGGSIDSSGHYLAPATITTTTTATVTATSAADTTKSGTATVTLNPPPISVTVSPATITISAGGGTQTFTANIANTTNQSVTWSVPAGQGSINSSGVYTPPATVPASSTITVTATSVADTSKSGTATITIAPISVTVAPTTVSVNANGGSQTFTATVTGTPNQAVTWSVPTGQGTITASGVYMAPTAVPTPPTVTVTATSVVDPTKSATATVTVTSPISVTVSPATITLSTNGTQTFTATVANTTNQAVTWSVPAGQGTINSSSGAYTAPATLPANPTVIVTATSTADPTKTGTATITLVAPAVTPATITLTGGATQQFNANFPTPTWTLSGPGTLTASGLYTAPPGQSCATQTATITATSGTITANAAATISPLPLPAGWTDLDIGSNGGNAGSASYNCSTSTFTVSGEGTDVYTIPDGFNFAYQALVGDGTIIGHMASVTNTFQYSKIGLMMRASLDASTPYVYVHTQPNNGGVTVGVRYTATQNPGSFNNTGGPLSWFKLVRVGNVFTPFTSADGITWIPAGGPVTVPMPTSIFVGMAITSVGGGLTTATFDNVSVTEAPITVTVAPATTFASATQTQQFTATLGQTANQNVTWTLTPTSGAGSISTTGLYTTPATVATQQTVTITATSAADTSKSGTATLTLLPPPAITPATISVNPGQTLQLTSAITSVTWQLTGPGTISPTGLYTAPAFVTAQQSVTVTAISTLDPTKSASAAITVLLVPGISPNPVTVVSGTTQQFIANFATPTWTVSAGPGSITAAGLYSAPPGICATGQTATITATSGTTTATATVNIGPSTALPTGWTDLDIGTTANAGSASYNCATTTFTISGQGTDVYNSPDGVNFAFTAFTGDGTIIARVPTINGAFQYSKVGIMIRASTDPTSPYAYMHLQPNNGGPDLLVRQTPGQSPAASIGSAYSVGPWLRLDRSGNSFTGYSSPDGVNWHRMDQSFTANMPASVLLGFAVTAVGPGLVTATIDNFSAVNAPVTISLTSPTLFVSAGQTEQFTTAIGNTFNTAVTFTLAGAGTISASGLYTPPTVIASEQTVTITAISAADPTKIASSTITLLPVPAVGPALVTLNAGQSQQFTSPISSVTWTANPGAPGTFTDKGLYTAPLVIIAPQTVTITATSTIDSTRTATSTITLWPPVNVTVTPSVSALAATQTLQLAASVLYSTNPAVTWTVNGPGSVSPTGIYTAPSTIATPTTATVVATSVADPTKSASLTITLGATNAISISPAAPVVVPGQTQQFLTSVAGPNQAVTYSLNPATGVGTISPTGLYTAPASICAQQTVTVTATSVADPTQKATTTITVSNANGYSYQRTLTINHTKVPNTDQNNFPVLVSGTYPFLASTANGGKVTNPKAYDITFTSDIGCRVKLNYELDQWNPATGQFTAWVQVPLVSHVSDTSIYLCYGNPAIAADQSAPKATWDGGYEGVWHFPAVAGSLSATDSTVNANAASAINGTASTPAGKIGSAASFNGATFIDFPSTNSLNTYTAQTVSLWINPTPGATGTYAGLLQKGDRFNLEWSMEFDCCNPSLLGFIYPSSAATIGTPPVADGNWHKLDLTIDTTGYFRGYVDGALLGNSSQGAPPNARTGFIRLGRHNGFDNLDRFFIGLADELRVSNYARSADWIATEFNNQNAPATFYSLGSETGETLNVSPSVISLSASQTQQFTATLPPTCGTAVAWSVTGLGTISGAGLYTAPATIASQTTATVTATTASGQFISAVVTLFPGETITLTPATVTLYSGEQQQFTGLVQNAANTSVTYTNPSGIGTLSASGLYTAPVNITALQTITLTATSGDTTKSATANIILAPGQGTPLTETKVAHVFAIIADALCRREHVAPVVNPGPSQTTSLVCSGTPSICQAGVTLAGSATSYTLAPGTNALSYAWTLVTGPAPVTFTNQTSPSATAVFSTAGNYTLQLAVNDGASIGTATTFVTVNPPSTFGQYTFLITPAASGPLGVNTPVTLRLQLSGIFTGYGPITLNITGANPATLNLNSDANGFYSYTYYGKNPGTDTINGIGFGNCCGVAPFNSNTATVSWINEPVKLTSSPVTGRFYTADGSGVFNTLASATPVFTQVFPNINFNASAPLTRPFTDIATDYTGAVVGPIPAQGNNVQAGVSTLFNFSAIFTGSFNVPSAGPVTFNFTSDDAFIFGIGGGTSRVSGPQTNTPALTTLQGLPVMGGINQREAPTTNAITVNFPAPGTYNYEVDYVKGGDKNLTLTMQSGGLPVPGTSILSLIPTQPGSLHTGAVGTWNILATDFDGAALSNIPVTITVTGLNGQIRTLNTDATGQGSVSYPGTNNATGSDQLQATAIVNGATIYSNVASVNWNNGINQAPQVSAGTPQTITIPAQAILTASAFDDGLPSNTLNLTWSKLSGPGTVTFDNPNQAVTAASFSTAGSYVLQLSATDGALTTTSTATVTVNPATNWSSGWLANPLDKSTVTQPVPVSLIPNITLTSGTLTYWPVNAPQSAVTLNANTTGAGQISTFDPTLLNNGSYFIVLSATNNQGVSMTSQVYVTVAGDYKPGRVTATVTDLKVPATGLPITISRTYDSLMRNQSMDFGYGWRLGIQVQMDVSPTGDVTFTINGQRRTFYFAPLPDPPFVYSVPHFTAEPGLYGSLVGNNDNCSGVVLRIGNVWQCAISNAGASYQPATYTYTDASGRVYTIASDGTLQSLKDLNNNTLTVTPAGISSTTGLSVPFIRDTQGRITKITDPLGNAYNYAYDANGNLSTLTLPPSPPTVLQPVTYTYDTTTCVAPIVQLPNPTHLLTCEKDSRGSTTTTTYYSDGKLRSTTDAVGNTTNYSYNTSNSTTTITYPPDAAGNVGTATLKYDSYGMLLSSVDPLTHTTTNAYNGNHQLISTTTPLGNTTTYTYDANGNQASITYPGTPTSVNTTSRTTYNQYGQITSKTDQLGNVQTYAYDANLNLTAITDQLGPFISVNYNGNGTLGGFGIGSLAGVNGKSYTYDPRGNPTAETDGIGRQVVRTYDGMGNILTEAYATSNGPVTISSQYDSQGRLTSFSIPGTGSETFTYDQNGNTLSETDASGNVTQYTYDQLDRISTITYPIPPPNVETRTYDFRGNLINLTDPNGHITHRDYDLAGRLAAETRAFGTAQASTTRFTYWDDGKPKSVVQPNGSFANYTYDAAGRLTGQADSQGNSTSYAYDDANRRISETDPNGLNTQFAYDIRGRLTTTTHPDHSTDQRALAVDGSLDSVTDQEGHVTKYQHDAVGQITNQQFLSAPDATHGIKTFQYDSLGRPASTTDANNHTEAYTYDASGRALTHSLAGVSTQEQWTYDDVNHKESQTDFNGFVSIRQYDSEGNLTTILPDARLSDHVISFAFSATGKRTQMQDASGTTTYSYDPKDRLVQKSTSAGSLSYTYDLNDNLTSVKSSNAGGISLSYTYDSLNRLSTVVDNSLPSGSNTTTYTYDPGSRLTSVTYPNGLQTSMALDTLGNITSMPLTRAGGVASYSYQRTATGRVHLSSEATGRTRTNSYDGAYRLVDELIANDPTGANGDLSYTYDPVDNRLTRASTISSLPNTTAAYNAADQAAGLTYDANGNLTAAPNHAYGYDFLNRLISVDGGSIRMQYDGDGNRIAKTVGPTTTQYLVDDLSLTGYPQVVEELVSGAVTRRYAYGLQRISQNQTISGQGTTSYYGYDGHGDVRLLTDQAGTVTDTYNYDAFGNTISSTGSTPNVFLYSGEQYDFDLGLYYLRARYLDPKSGRFITRDSEFGFEERTPNRYVYAESDPVNRHDPSGNGSLFEALPLYAYEVPATFTIGTLVRIGIQQITCLAVQEAVTSLASEFISRGLGQFAARYWNVAAGDAARIEGVAGQGVVAEGKRVVAVYRVHLLGDSEYAKTTNRALEAAAAAIKKQVQAAGGEYIEKVVDRTVSQAERLVVHAERQIVSFVRSLGNKWALFSVASKKIPCPVCYPILRRLSWTKWLIKTCVF